MLGGVVSGQPLEDDGNLLGFRAACLLYTARCTRLS
jgi:hypothetical protein